MILFQPAVRLGDPFRVRERPYSTIYYPLFQQKAFHIPHCYAFFVPPGGASALKRTTCKSGFRRQTRNRIEYFLFTS